MYNDILKTLTFRFGWEALYANHSTALIDQPGILQNCFPAGRCWR